MNRLRKWFEKSQNKKVIDIIHAENEEEADKIFLEKYPEFKEELRKRRNQEMQ